jgi:hypothetical protein
LQLKKDKKTKEHLKTGQKFLYEELLEYQIKLIELEERVESRHVEFCAGEEMKKQKEPNKPPCVTEQVFPWVSGPAVLHFKHNSTKRG